VVETGGRMSESCPKKSSEGRESRPHVEGDENGNACELVITVNATV